jgi:DHA2 family multidrug resistance protein-like MFS transporter
VLGSLGTAVYRSNLEANLPGGVPGAVADASLDSLGGAIESASQMTAVVGDALASAARAAFVDGLHVTTGVTAVVAVVFAVVVTVLLRSVPLAGATSPRAFRPTSLPRSASTPTSRWWPDELPAPRRRAVG